MDDTTRLTRCPRCGASLTVGAPDGLCPACLLAAALDPPSIPSDEHQTTAFASSAPGLHRPRLTAGAMFGPYRIGRLLGSGGMGDVYEAEHLDQDRRVALKVLKERLSGTGDRARFLREGQLAASITHPHTVYIFGSEEIDGTPAIVMELLPGGTLKDRVSDQGPLPPVEAVDAILQVIAGLDAMQAAGVLHRDIKPANCFVDSDGTVKVGDFGLSISTTARELSQLTMAGTFRGTPQFAPPEQLRGDPLDVRADIYAVGATLYYLLTGRPPFDDTDLIALITRIATELPQSPRSLRSEIPRGLAAIVLRCLAKEAAARPATYASLHEALRRFSSAAPAPAGIGPRIAAGMIDQALVNVSTLLFVFPLAVDGRFFTGGSAAVVTIAMSIAYYSVLEGIWGATIGKRLFRLCVASASSSQPPGVLRASWRSLLFEIPVIVTVLERLLLGEGRLIEITSQSFLLTVANGSLRWIGIAILFSTARRANGFAAIHDQWSNTRVIGRVAARAGAESVLAAPPAIAGNAFARRLGPFAVVDFLGATDVGTLWLAFDPRLRRRVWIHEVPLDGPPTSSSVRIHNRGTRLRWLDGRRTASEAWDAYEALDGTALVAMLTRPQPWRIVRQWLADVAREIDASLHDETLTQLSLDRLWVTAAGCVKLLDFRAPDAPAESAPASPASLESARSFVVDLARRALAGSTPGEAATRDALPRHRLPLSALELIDALDRREASSWPDVVRRTAALANGPDRVDRRRRVIPLALAAAAPACMMATVALVTWTMRPMLARVMTSETTDLSFDLFLASRPPDPDGDVDHAALETYIAGRFGRMLADPSVWSDPMTGVVLGRYRTVAERIMAEHPHVSAAEMAAATAALSQHLARQQRARQRTDASSGSWQMAFTLGMMVFVLTAIVGLVSAALFRGGLMLRAFDIAVVTRTGSRVTRLRGLLRAVVAWGPLLAAGGAAPMTTMMAARALDQNAAFTIAAWAIFVGGAAYAVLNPERGLQDRIAGTYLVPR